MIAITDTVSIADEEFDWSYARSGGPGGQNVNKVASKATLRWNLAASPALGPVAKKRLIAAHPSLVTTEGELLITSQEYRDQERNRERCIEKFVEIIRAALTPPKPRHKTKPTRSSERRRIEDKKKQSAKKTTRRDVGGE